jgi:pimeloyl-ACP methyl ester carboxylesterase
MNIPNALLPLLLALVLGGARAAESAVTLQTATGTLHGSLLVPDGRARMPVVLLIAGSGPVDRDGNLPTMRGINNSLKELAERLAQAGIASLRYDKRGIAASWQAAGDEADLRLEQFADDAAGWVRQLRADGRYSRVVIVGHSEGGLVGMLAAQRARPDAFVALATAGRPLQDVLREQLGRQLVPAQIEENERILQALTAGRTIAVDTPSLALLYRASVQPYLISAFRYAPRELIAKLDLPVLIVQGKADLQVTVADALALKAARPDAKLVLVDGMNHVFKLTGDDRTLQMQSYMRPDLPVAPVLVAAIADFVNGTGE